jgi:hypothetical protein
MTQSLLLEWFCGFRFHSVSEHSEIPKRRKEEEEEERKKKKENEFIITQLT